MAQQHKNGERDVLGRTPEEIAALNAINGIATEVVTAERQEFTGLNRADFAQVSSFADAVAALGGIDEIHEASPDLIGDGSVRLDKDDLVGVPFLITGYTESEGVADEDTGEVTQFLVIRGITQSGTKFFITDGSREAGLRPDLLKFTERTGKRFLMCPRGLQKSVYKTKDANGKPIDGTTFFVDTRKRV